MLRGVQELMCNTAIGPGNGKRMGDGGARLGQSRNRVDGIIITTSFLHVGFQ